MLSFGWNYRDVASCLLSKDRCDEVSSYDCCSLLCNFKCVKVKDCTINQNLLCSQFQFPHSYKHLMNLCQSLFVPMNKKLRKMLQMCRYKFEGFRVVIRQLDLFPQVFRCMRSFCSLQEQVTVAFFLSNSSIATVGQWARTGTVQ
jgi:hypothetical protein